MKVFADSTAAVSSFAFARSRYQECATTFISSEVGFISGAERFHGAECAVHGI